MTEVLEAIDIQYSCAFPLSSGIYGMSQIDHLSELQVELSSFSERASLRPGSTFNCRNTLYSDIEVVSTYLHDTWRTGRRKQRTNLHALHSGGPQTSPGPFSASLSATSFVPVTIQYDTVSTDRFWY